MDDVAKMKVLVCDDEALARMRLKRLVEMAHMEVTGKPPAAAKRWNAPAARAPTCCSWISACRTWMAWKPPATCRKWSTRRR